MPSTVESAARQRYFHYPITLAYVRSVRYGMPQSLPQPRLPRQRQPAISAEITTPGGETRQARAIRISS